MCFNGATTYSLWKAGNIGIFKTGHLLLQWGHNILVVESRCHLVLPFAWEGLQWGHNILVVESALAIVAVGARIVASMGPQHTRCGKLPSYNTACLRPACFNGATTYSLWKVRCRRTSACRDPCFNGATTYSLWKAPGTALLRRPLIRFNGATTYSLWKVVFDDGPQHLLLDASMGPQHTRCGKPLLVLWQNTHVHASMGPQHTRCGKRVSGGGHSGRHHASMGPQHTRCGKDDPWSTGVFRFHSFNGATTYSLWKACWSMRALHQTSGFNGATTYSLWKDHLRIVYLVLHLVASMGPQHTRCGKSPRRPWATRSGTSFNGATTYSLWKEDLPAKSRSSHHTLQWGHNILVVESGRLVPALFERDNASMGPQHTRCGKWQADRRLYRRRLCFNGATTYSLWKA